MAVWYRTEDWTGATWGRSHSFLATDDDVLELLRTALPIKFAPYTVMGFDNVKVTDRYRHVFATTEIAEFPLLRKMSFDMYFIRSETISPGLDLSGLRFIDTYLTANGLINLQHGLVTNKLGWTPSNIGLIHRIAHRQTGERVTHHDYEKVFFALRRAVKKMVRYRALRVLPSGEETEERHIHMTECFVAKLRSGEIKSAYYPGDPL